MTSKQRSVMGTLIVVSVLSIGILIAKFTNKEQKPIAQTFETTNLPPLPQLGAWTNLNVKESQDYLVYIDSPTADKTEIKLNGTLNKLELNEISTTEEMQRYAALFQSYYETRLGNTNWKKHKIESEQQTLTGPDADGINGSVASYLKSSPQGYNLLGIKLEKGPFDNSEAPKLKCPCSIKFEVFESEYFKVN